METEWAVTWVNNGFVYVSAQGAPELADYDITKIPKTIFAYFLACPIFAN